MMKQAMIFAAGLGTRLKPLTDHMPKALVPVGGVPLLRRVVDRLADAGFGRMVVNVHHFASQITEYIDENKNFGLDIQVSDERDHLLDTGGGLKKAAPLFDADSPILIHNVDILSNVDLGKLYAEARPGGATLLVSWRKTKRYLVFRDDMRLAGWVNVESGEVKSPFADVRQALSALSYPLPVGNEPCRVGAFHLYAFSGIHVFPPAFFALMESCPDRFPIMDFYLDHCDQVPIWGRVAEGLRLMDVGKQDTLRQAEEFLDTLRQPSDKGFSLR